MKYCNNTNGRFNGNISESPFIREIQSVNQKLFTIILTCIIYIFVENTMFSPNSYIRYSFTFYVKYNLNMVSDFIRNIFGVIDEKHIIIAVVDGTLF